MKRSLATFMQPHVDTDNIVEVVFNGKVKGDRFVVAEVLLDGIVLLPEAPDSQRAAYPFTAIKSMRLADEPKV